MVRWPVWFLCVFVECKMNANHGIEGRCNYSSKCDRCGVTIGLLRHNKGYRCPECIWKEREDVIREVNTLINSIDISERNLREKTLTVSRPQIDALHKAVLFAEREVED